MKIKQWCFDMQNIDRPTYLNIEIITIKGNSHYMQFIAAKLSISTAKLWLQGIELIHHFNWQIQLSYVFISSYNVFN